MSKQVGVSAEEAIAIHRAGWALVGDVLAGASPELLDAGGPGASLRERLAQLSPQDPAPVVVPGLDGSKRPKAQHVKVPVLGVPVSVIEHYTVELAPHRPYGEYTVRPSPYLTVNRKTAAKVIRAAAANVVAIHESTFDGMIDGSRGVNKEVDPEVVARFLDKHDGCTLRVSWTRGELSVHDACDSYRVELRGAP